ncbi:flagellar basal-body rod protein FlgF [Betaproteobacteria bacterium]|nr:flagellar basal-body rod protein FlgF [Betaproteobacteria bacterium]GHT95209.1 flagellar basal-body rod protein FlgF [Betaproteobacteria bacterium]GHU01412.1 flagellar basal-body rod protein FlgF [Betaproteobacteria bacterium]GHU10366.1 flagellar basal-body rod protein FlgF [Betaproteobacteria bacterium]GHU21933.1 flagellar basal-body rod protein FlgF [Betaproteobacteria bacterium]
MDRVIYTAMTGAKSTLGQQGAVAHNLANADSTGFRLEMHKLRAVEVQTKAYHSRAFVVDASVATDFTPGPLKFSGRPYDVAIQGKGWLSVQMPDGSEAYTRDGSLMLSAEGVLQTRGGLPILGDGGPITLPPDSEIVIGDDGTISAIQNQLTNDIGRLKLVNPPEAELERGEDGYFRLQGGAAAPVDEAVKVAGGYLESSNVNVADQMVTMISLARQFEMQMRMISNAEQNDRAGMQVLSAR